MSQNDPRPSEPNPWIPRQGTPERPGPPPGPPPGGYVPPPGSPPPGAPGHGGPGYGGPPRNGPGYGPPPGGPAYGPPPGGPGLGAPPPGPGYGPHPGGPRQGTPPGGPAYRPPAADIRPRRRWILAAWLVAIASLVAGIVIGFGTVTKTIDQAAPTHVFPSGGKVSAPLDPADKPILYASSSGPANVTCLAQDSAGNPVKLTNVSLHQTVTVNGRTWEGMFDIAVPAAGTYEISCRSEGGQVVFGVGKTLTAAVGTVAGGAAAAFLIPTAGFLLAFVVTIVVIVRRRGARRRLAAASPGGAWSQGTPYGA
ncbi:hypothetical protein [Sphaerisporangium sp. NPDC051011]|uniref:hypothetical protein n=1 Tax=Sphaerisporangium sp. NPDC051011 TaxID=3155792 RepID=UPI0034033CD5